MKMEYVIVICMVNNVRPVWLQNFKFAAYCKIVKRKFRNPIKCVTDNESGSALLESVGTNNVFDPSKFQIFESINKVGIFKNP